MQKPFSSLCTASILFVLTLAGMNSSRAQTAAPAGGEGAVAAPAPTAGDPAAVNEVPTGKTEEDLIRERSIAEFTRKMKEANYPALFEQAAKEFGVPADILEGVSFAETRWEHLQWPPGETVSPENGMPRPYGIMSLWDNDYFGHSLLDAAKLIGKDPEELKSDPLQNMRGAAALLKKIYNETPKPADAQGDEIESWRKAIVKYCGIPQAELSEQHGLEVYEHMNEGYHDYGIEWPKHPVNLEPMRAEVAKIKAEARAKTEAEEKAEEAKNLIPAVAKKTISGKSIKAETMPIVASGSAPSRPAWVTWVAILAGLLIVAVAFYMMRSPKNVSSRK